MQYTTKEERDTLTALMNEMESWLYSDDSGQDNTEILTNKSKALHEFGSEVFKKYNQWDHLNHAIVALQHSVTNITQKYEENNALVSKNGHLFLLASDMEEIKKSVNLYTEKMKEAMTQISSASRLTSPPILADTINTYNTDFNNVQLHFFKN